MLSDRVPFRRGGIDSMSAHRTLGTMWDTEQKADIVHENEWVTLWYHPEPKIVHHRFHKPIRGEAFQNVLTIGTDILRANGATKWLADDRLFFVLPEEDQKWAEGEWFPRTRLAGWKYWAVVKPQLAVTDLYLRRVAASPTAAGVRMEVFPTPAHAAEWLLNVESIPPPVSSGRRARGP
jgi:hypothetical protein